MERKWNAGISHVALGGRRSKACDALSRIALCFIRSTRFFTYRCVHRLVEGVARDRLDVTRPARHFLDKYSGQKGNVMLGLLWSVQQAKNRFSALVEAARHAPQTVTKHGKPAVVVVDAGEYQRLQRLERAQAPSFAETLLAMPQDDAEFPRASVRPRDLVL